MKKNKIIYWIFTGLLSLMMMMQSYMFIFNSGQMAELFNHLNISTALIIPLGVAKALAVIAILSKKSKLLKTLAYYGLATDFLSAFVSHLVAGDGDWTAATVALVLLGGSYFYDRKLF